MTQQPAPELKLEPSELGGGFDPATAGLAVLDADGDLVPDLLAGSKQGILLFRGGAVKVEATGLQDLRDVVAVAAGDFDNDGLADLCVLSPGPSLWRNAGAGRFEKVAAALPPGPFSAAVWLDFDHDYDLDLVLVGERWALLRNIGEGSGAPRDGATPRPASRSLPARRSPRRCSTRSRKCREKTWSWPMPASRE